MLRNMLLVVGSLLFAGLLAEGMLRVAGYSYVQFHQPDPVLGWTLRPGAEGWFRKEGGAYIRINSQGLRDREHSFEKPPNTIRVALLGDSYAEALQVPLDQTFWAVAERRMNERCEALGDRTVEFINFGVSDYGTAQELLTLRHRVWQYEPDVVVLAFLTGNDIRNNSRVLDDQPGRPRRPYFELRDGELVLDDGFRERRRDDTGAGWPGRLFEWGARYSRCLQLAKDLRAQWTIWRFRRERAKRSSAEAGGAGSIYTAPEHGPWREAWHVTEALIRQMAREVRARDTGFVVMTLSNGAEVNPDRQVRAAVRSRFGVEDLGYADRRILGLAEQDGATGVTVVPALQAWAETSGQCVHGFENGTPCRGHWNSDGHRIAGRVLAEALCEKLAASHAGGA